MTEFFRRTSKIEITDMIPLGSKAQLQKKVEDKWKLFDINEVLETTYDYTGLRTVFNIKKDNKSSLNSSWIEIYNLNRASVGRFTGRNSKTRITFSVGYEGLDGTGEPFQICRSDVESQSISYSGKDVALRFSLRDGAYSTNEVLVSKSWGKDVSIKVVTDYLITALNIDIGYYNLDITKSVKKVNDFVLYGNPYTLLYDILWEDHDIYIQDNKLNICRQSDTIIYKVVPHISKDSGMIGTPIYKKDNILEVKSLINTDVEVGSLFTVGSVYSEIEQNKYKAISILYKGDTHGADWSMTIEGVPEGTRYA